MQLKELMKRALQCSAPSGAVPLWELHFHMWNAFSKVPFVSGAEFMQLSSANRQYAIERNADIIVDVAQRLHMAAVSIPDAPWDCPYTLPNDSRIELIRQLKRRAPDFLIIAGCSGNISMPSTADGFVNFCYMLIDDPESVDKQCQRQYDNGCHLLNALAEAGVEAVYNAADMAANRGQFFSPQQMERFIWPYLERWNEYVRRNGVFSILHTDGNVEKLLTGYIKSGVQALQALDPISGMSLARSRAIVGDNMALCGNLDCSLMLAGSPESIYKNTYKLLLEDGMSGGMVLGCSNAVVIQTPRQNYEALLNAYNDWSISVSTR